MEGDDGRKSWGIALSYSAMGIELAIGIVGGYLLGDWLDARYGTKPILMLVMLGLGTAAGFISLIRTTARINRRLEAEDDPDESEEQQ
jgi:ATP synthase protein I